MTEPCPGNCVTQAMLDREVKHIRELIDERDRANQRAVDLAATRVANEAQRLVVYATLFLTALCLALPVALHYMGR